MDRVVLVDGKNFAYRFHYTHRQLSSRGRPTSILYGVLAGLLSLSKRFGNSPIVFVWDGAGPTWRHKLAPTVYKANRQGPPNAEVEKMHRQLPILCGVLNEIGIRQFVISNLECDDLIGVLTTAIIKKNLFEQVVVYSTDKDFFQLCSDRVKVIQKDFAAKRKEWRGRKVRFVDDAYTRKEYGVPLKDWLTFRAITGDPSDNIPGAKRGVGPVAAKKLIAAGLDAGVPSFDKLSKKAKNKFADFEDAWPALHRNFILSNIIRTPVHGMLPSDVSRELRAVVRQLDRKALLHRRVPDCNFQSFTEFCLDYDMLGLLAKRRALWQLR